MADGVRLRDAGPEDGDALARAVVEAVDWRGRFDLDVAGVLAVPELAHYVTGWPRPGPRRDPVRRRAGPMLLELRG